MTNNDGRIGVVGIQSVFSKIVFAPIYTRRAIEVVAEICFTLAAVNGPRAKVSLLCCCCAVFTTDAPDVYVLIMKTLTRKCTEKVVIFQLAERVICYFKAVGGKVAGCSQMCRVGQPKIAL